MPYLLSLWDKSVREWLISPPAARLFDLILPNLHTLLWSGTLGNSSTHLVDIQVAIDYLTWKTLYLVVTCLNDKIFSVNCKLCLFSLIVIEQWSYAQFIHKNYFSRVKKEVNESVDWELCYLFVDNLCIKKKETILWHKLVAANDSAATEKCHCCYHL